MNLCILNAVLCCYTVVLSHFMSIIFNAFKYLTQANSSDSYFILNKNTTEYNTTLRPFVVCIILISAHRVSASLKSVVQMRWLHLSLFLSVNLEALELRSSVTWKLIHKHCTSSQNLIILFNIQCPSIQSARNCAP